MHCFSMPEQLDECLARGYWISFAGNVTYKSASELAAAAARVPQDRMLVETDAPYLTPQVVRKHRNQPAFVAHTVSFLAALRGADAALLGQALEQHQASLPSCVGGAASSSPCAGTRSTPHSRRASNQL